MLDDMLHKGGIDEAAAIERADFTRKRKSFGEPGPRYTQSADLIEEVRGFAHRLRPFVEAPPF